MADVLIAGGGIAGSSLAVMLGRKGFAVELFEKAQFPREKPCGEGLMPAGVAVLKRLDPSGALGTIAGGYPFAGVRFYFENAAGGRENYKAFSFCSPGVGQRPQSAGPGATFLRSGQLRCTRAHWNSCRRPYNEKWHCSGSDGRGPAIPRSARDCGGRRAFHDSQKAWFEYPSPHGSFRGPRAFPFSQRQGTNPLGRSFRRCRSRNICHTASARGDFRGAVNKVWRRTI